VFINIALTIALVTPLWHFGVVGAHAGIALATALAGVANAVLLWRYLGRTGLYRPEPGWRRLALQIATGCAFMAATVLGMRLWAGEWTAMGWWLRLGWLLAAVAAGGAAYAAGLVLTGLRPRHLREG
jgi:putative peptidoglycan lipid II flippase